MYDLSTKKEVHTTNVSAYPQAFYGDRIVWTDGLNGKHNIYVGVLVFPTVALFSSSPTFGKAPLSVKFTDKSTGSPTSWAWNFGDKSTSIDRNPVHKYTKNELTQ
jgi:PKD repeat protein